MPERPANAAHRASLTLGGSLLNFLYANPFHGCHMTSVDSPLEDEVERLEARVRTLEGERKHLLAVIEILQEIAGSLHFVDVVQSVARRLGEAFGLDRCSIFLVEKGGQTVRLVASYEDPSIRNYVVDVDRYPELKQALESGQTVFIPDAAADPSLKHVRGALANRRVKSITVVPITWRGAAIGAILLRTFRDSSGFSDADVEFCQVVASLTAKALRNATSSNACRNARVAKMSKRAVTRSVPPCSDSSAGCWTSTPPARDPGARAPWARRQPKRWTAWSGWQWPSSVRRPLPGELLRGRIRRAPPR